MASGSKSAWNIFWQHFILVTVRLETSCRLCLRLNVQKARDKASTQDVGCPRFTAILWGSTSDHFPLFSHIIAGRIHRAISSPQSWTMRKCMASTSNTANKIIINLSSRGYTDLYSRMSSTWNFTCHGKINAIRASATNTLPQKTKTISGNHTKTTPTGRTPPANNSRKEKRTLPKERSILSRWICQQFDIVQQWKPSPFFINADFLWITWPSTIMVRRMHSTCGTKHLLVVAPRKSVLVFGSTLRRRAMVSPS